MGEAVTASTELSDALHPAPEKAAQEFVTIGADGALGGYMAKVAQNNVDITMKTFFSEYIRGGDPAPRRGRSAGLAGKYGLFRGAGGSETPRRILRRPDDP